MRTLIVIPISDPECIIILNGNVKNSFVYLIRAENGWTNNKNNNLQKNQSEK